MTELVLKNNYFEFNSKFWKQIQGTAIGTKFAPPYAIIFMAALEENFLNSSNKKPLLWWRYIDDIFTIWEHGEKALEEFMDRLNSFHDTIKFTYEYSKEKVNFLDVQVINKNGILTTDLYIKETDSHQYLHPSSCHPYHCIKSIPYSQALRINRICSETEFLDKRCNQLEEWLLTRNYNPNMVREQILKARSHKRSDLLNKNKNISNNERVVFSLPYHPILKDFQKVLNELHIILTHNEEHKKVFKDIPMIGWRKPKSLKDHLVKAKLTEQKVLSSKCAPCNKSKRCQVCQFLTECTTFSDRGKNVSFEIRNGNFNCDSSNVVYLIECKTCSMQYIGSTTTKFRTRLNNYKSSFRKYVSGKKSLPQEHFHKHFSAEGHNGIDDWAIKIIDQAENEISLRRRESFWQYKLQTFSPLGLNERDVVTW